MIAIILTALVAGFQTGVLSTGGNSSTPTPRSSPSPKPTSSPTTVPTVTPTQNPTNSPTSSPSPTPTLPPPSLSATVTGSNYYESWSQYTKFDCTVKINNPAYNSIIDKMTTAQNFTVTNIITNQQVTGNLTTALQNSFLQLGMNYGIGNNMTISNVNNGQFTLTMYSETRTVLPGGINLDTLGNALTTQFNQLLATQV